MVPDRAKQLRDLQPDTLCTFSPNPAELQPDARWSPIVDDEEMETNARYAVSTPGVLKLWPWVNQVRHCVQPLTLYLNTRRSDASHGLLQIAP